MSNNYGETYIKYKEDFINELTRIDGNVNRFNSLISRLESCRNKLLLANTVNAVNIMADMKSTQQKSIDPYVAAGLGTAIGGVAGGVIAGTDALAKKQKYEEIRTQNRLDVIESKGKVLSVLNCNSKIHT